MNINAINKNLYSSTHSSVYQNKLKTPEKVSVPKSDIKKETKNVNDNKYVEKLKHNEEKNIKDAYEKLSSESNFEKDKIISTKEDETAFEKEQALLEKKKEEIQQEKEKEFKENLKEINKEYVKENIEDVEKMLKSMQIRQEIKTQISMQKRIEDTIEKISDEKEVENKDIKEVNGQRIEEFKNQAEKQTKYLKEVLTSIKDKEKSHHFNPQKEKIDKLNITI